MAISEFYESGEQKSNFAHFSAIVNLAGADGQINRLEEKVLTQLATKLDVSREESTLIFKKPNGYPTIPPYSLEKRMERLHDLFSIIYADYKIDDAELKLIFKYAIGLGFTNQEATNEIKNCVRVFGDDAEFED